MEALDRHNHIHEMLKKADIHSDFYLQYQLLCHVKLLWKDLTQEDRDKYTSLLAPMLSRIAQAKDADAARFSVARIIQLEPEDIFDALRLTPQKTADYTLVDGEDIYPSGQDEWLGRYLNWARGGNAPLAFHFWSAMTLLGFVCGRRIWVPAGTQVYMNMYTVLGADRSAGKGQALSAASYLIERVNSKLEARDGQDSENLLNVIPSDATIESVVSFLGRPPGGVEVDIDRDEEGLVTISEPTRDAVGFLPLDEMATFLGKDVWNITQKIPFLTSAKESKRYRKMTKANGIEDLNNLALSILANVAPDWMQNTIEMDILGGGLGDRILWCYRDPVWDRRRQHNLMNGQPLDPLAAEFLADFLINNIIDLGFKVPAILDPDAQNEMDLFHREMVEREYQSYVKFGTEARENTSNRVLWMALQISTLLAVSEGNFPPLRVRKRHVELARLLYKAEEESMRVFMDRASGKKNKYWTTQIVDYLKKNGGCVGRGVVHQYFNPKLSNGTKYHINLLKDQEMVEEVDLGKRGYYRTVGHECNSCTR